MSDRKYRHSGYQDGGGYDKKSRDNTPRPPMEPRKERLEGAPRGRTAGGFGPEVFKCHRCGLSKQALGEVEVLPESQCDCGADLHTCWNCKHFDTSTRWECRENIPARVSAKDARNACAMFAPKMVKDLAADKRSMPKTPNDARAAFEALFKK